MNWAQKPMCEAQNWGNYARTNPNGAFFKPPNERFGELHGGSTE